MQVAICYVDVDYCCAAEQEKTMLTSRVRCFPSCEYSRDGAKHFPTYSTSSPKEIEIMAKTESCPQKLLSVSQVSAHVVFNIVQYSTLLIMDTCEF